MRRVHAIGALCAVVAAVPILCLPDHARAQGEEPEEVAPGAPGAQAPADDEGGPAPGAPPADGLPAGPDGAAGQTGERPDAAQRPGGAEADREPGTQRVQDGAPQRPLRRMAPAGAQQADAWRALLGPDAQVAQRAELAARDLAAAERALAAGDEEAARTALGAATSTLATLLAEAPGAALATELGGVAAALQLPDADGAALRSLAAEVRAMEPVLPPAAVTRVADAAARMEAGDADAATRALLEARELLLVDLALLPIEQAFARSRAALAELDAGDPARALALVQGVPAAIAQTRGEAPLVSTRLRLRAAAHHAAQREWVEAEALLNEASDALADVRATAGPPLARRIDALGARIAALRETIAGGHFPPAARFRQVAESARGVPAG